MFSIVGVQSMPPQNMPLWYVDYLKLKTLEKQQMQEGHSYLPFSFQKQEIKYPYALSVPEEGSILITRDWGVQAERNLYQETSLN